MKWVKRIFLLFVVVLLVGVGFIYWTLSYVPPKYTKLVEAEVAAPEKLAENSDRMVRRSTELVNKLNLKGRWQTTFSQDEINGWLAVDLPQKHANEMPEDFSKPRVLIEPSGITLFAVYEKFPIDVVATVTIKPELLQPNILRITLTDVKAGSYSFPLEMIKEQIEDEVARAKNTDLKVTWQHVDGCPAAMITWNGRVDNENGRQRTIDQLALRDGQVYFAGTTEED